ncbi:hypothetical protein A3843_02070 [Pseudovibrio exalbescens]|uniref:Uncharacterized protein n=1 Tax=Pseudovibrio exalbescens TaxID=197461 RepID=A0A1U7JM23_9HYPH|nr:hypothetical protein [Pseudovibrio exalbescens]OKL45742.1 hypothetical protein A3843_02070 [Pseudovibrio exalbescens]
MDDRSPGLTYDRVKWLFDLQHRAQPSDVMPHLMRHPEQHGTEDAAAALLDPGSEAGVTEVGWTIGPRASLMTA